MCWQPRPMPLMFNAEPGRRWSLSLPPPHGSQTDTLYGLNGSAPKPIRLPASGVRRGVFHRAAQTQLGLRGNLQEPFPNRFRSQSLESRGASASEGKIDCLVSANPHGLAESKHRLHYPALLNIYSLNAVLQHDMGCSIYYSYRKALAHTVDVEERQSLFLPDAWRSKAQIVKKTIKTHNITKFEE